VQEFKDGDEQALIDLFNKTYAKFGGYTDKTPEYWRWCLLNRSDVERPGIIVAVTKDKKTIVGYVVAGKSGNLWELAYDPLNDERGVVTFLLEKAEEYLLSIGANSVNLAAPQTDKTVRHICRTFGYADVPSPHMFFAVLNYESLLKLLAKNLSTELKTTFKETIHITIEKAPSWIEHDLFIEINKDGIHKVSNHCSPEFNIKTDYFTLSSMLFGNTTPLNALLRLKLKVTPAKKTVVAVKILSQLKLKTEWAFPLSEFG
jgi:hypothetical protein